MKLVEGLLASYHAKSRLVDLHRLGREHLTDLRHRAAESTGILRGAVDRYIQDLAWVTPR